MASANRGGTYISMEFGEGMNHIKSVHIYYSSVYNQLRAGRTVKVQCVNVQGLKAVNAFSFQRRAISYQNVGFDDKTKDRIKLNSTRLAVWYSPFGL